MARVAYPNLHNTARLITWIITKQKHSGEDAVKYDGKCPDVHRGRGKTNKVLQKNFRRSEDCRRVDFTLDWVCSIEDE